MKEITITFSNKNYKRIAKHAKESGLTIEDFIIKAVENQIYLKELDRIRKK